MPQVHRTVLTSFGQKSSLRGCASGSQAGLLSLFYRLVVQLKDAYWKFCFLNFSYRV
jgi:hypothetical protein